MTKAELVEKMATKSRLTKKDTTAFIDMLFKQVGDAVKATGRFSYPGFGTWSLRSRKARKIRNPQSHELMKLAASRTVGFRPAKELKATL